MTGNGDKELETTQQEDSEKIWVDRMNKRLDKIQAALEREGYTVEGGDLEQKKEGLPSDIRRVLEEFGSDLINPRLPISPASSVTGEPGGDQTTPRKSTWGQRVVTITPPADGLEH